MAERLDREARMTLHHLAKRGHTKCEIARLLGVTEGTVRYHLKGSVNNLSLFLSAVVPVWFHAAETSVSAAFVNNSIAI